MGIFDNDDSEEEVTISPNSENQEESRLKDEVESEIVSEKSSKNPSGNPSESSSRSSSRGQKMRERSNSKGKSTFGSDGVSLNDIHRQNERIIELLEELNGEGSNTEKGEQSEMSGDLNGVL